MYVSWAGPDPLDQNDIVVLDGQHYMVTEIPGEPVEVKLTIRGEPEPRILHLHSEVKLARVRPEIARHVQELRNYVSYLCGPDGS